MVRRKGRKGRRMVRRVRKVRRRVRRRVRMVRRMVRRKGRKGRRVRRMVRPSGPPNRIAGESMIDPVVAVKRELEPIIKALKKLGAEFYDGRYYYSFVCPCDEWSDCECDNEMTFMVDRANRLLDIASQLERRA